MEQKALLGVEIKDEAKGEFEAVFATFNEVDSDGDVTLPGAFEHGAKVRISAYGHASGGPTRGASSVPIPPVGKGVIHASTAEATVAGGFFMKTEGGRETFEIVKEMGDLQEWSYGYDTLDHAFGEFKGRRVRFLKRQKVHEISPVLVAAGVGTRTLAVKGAKVLDSELRAVLDEAGREKWGGDETYVYVDDFDVDESWAVYSVSQKDGESRHLRVSYSRSDDEGVALADDAAEVERSTTYTPKGLTFSDEADRTLAGVKDFVERSEALAALRAKEGRVLSAANRERLAELATSLGEASAALASLLEGTDPGKQRGLEEALDIETSLAAWTARLRLRS